MQFAGSTPKRQACRLPSPAEGQGCSSPPAPRNRGHGAGCAWSRQQEHHPEPDHLLLDSSVMVTEARICRPAFSVKGQTVNIWAVRVMWPLPHPLSTAVLEVEQPQTISA